MYIFCREKNLESFEEKKKQVTKFYKFLTLASSITIIAGIENGWHDKQTMVASAVRTDKKNFGI